MSSGISAITSGDTLSRGASSSGVTLGKFSVGDSIGAFDLVASGSRLGEYTRSIDKESEETYCHPFLCDCLQPSVSDVLRTLDILGMLG